LASPYSRCGIFYSRCTRCRHFGTFGIHIGNFCTVPK